MWWSPKESSSTPANRDILMSDEWLQGLTKTAATLSFVWSLWLKLLHERQRVRCISGQIQSYERHFFVKVIPFIGKRKNKVGGLFLTGQKLKFSCTFKYLALNYACYHDSTECALGQLQRLLCSRKSANPAELNPLLGAAVSLHSSLKTHKKLQLAQPHGEKLTHHIRVTTCGSLEAYETQQTVSLCEMRAQKDSAPVSSVPDTHSWDCLVYNSYSCCPPALLVHMKSLLTDTD